MVGWRMLLLVREPGYLSAMFRQVTVYGLAFVSSYFQRYPCADLEFFKQNTNFMDRQDLGRVVLIWGLLLKDVGKGFFFIKWLILACWTM